MENDFQKIVDCIICKKKAIFFIHKNNFDLFCCQSCRLIFVWPIPQHLNAIYNQDYFSGAIHGFGYTDYDADKVAMVSTFNDYLKIIEGYAIGQGLLLDVGAATGFFMDLAKQKGWEVKGVEISDFAAQKARNKGLVVKTGTLELMVFSELFKVITMWDVIEHVDDPASQIKKAYELLAPGGILVINTPDASSFFARILSKRWHLFVPPEHLFYFNPNNLGEILRSAGFTILKTGKLGKKFTIQYILHTLSRWSKIKCLEQLTYKLRGTAMGNIAVPINLRDNFFIIAQK